MMLRCPIRVLCQPSCHQCPPRFRRIECDASLCAWRHAVLQQGMRRRFRELQLGSGGPSSLWSATLLQTTS